MADKYTTYLEQHLPEYVAPADIARPGARAASAITLTLRNAELAKYGFVKPAWLPHPQQAPSLVIHGNDEGKQRMNELKHYVNKRNLIMKTLAESDEARTAGLVLKRYTRWDNFLVGKEGTTSHDMPYVHLAALKKDLDKLRAPTQRDWFLVRRFFHMTTPEQKEQMIRDFLRDNHNLYELVSFTHKNQFVIAHRDPARRRETPPIELHSFSALRRELTGNPGGVSGFAQWAFGKLVDKLAASERERRLAEEIARIRAQVPDDMRMYIQRDMLQKKFVDAQVRIVEGKRSVVHQALMAMKIQLVGKHARRHPLRCLRLMVGKLVSGTSAVVGKVQEMRGIVPPVETIGEKMIGEMRDQLKEAGKLAGGVLAESAAERLGLASTNPTPGWLQDLGWGTTDMKADQDAWNDIEEHLNSLEKHEGELKSVLSHIAAAHDGNPATCDHVDQALFRHAKMVFHLRGMKSLFKQQAEYFQEMSRTLSEGFARMQSQEMLVKELARDFARRENQAYDLLLEIDMRRYSVMQQMRLEGASLDIALTTESTMPADVDSVVQFTEAATA